MHFGAYYFPGFHRDPKTDKWHGEGWTEWDVLAAARPRFPDHQQPKSSAWGDFDEADPPGRRNNPISRRNTESTSSSSTGTSTSTVRSSTPPWTPGTSRRT